MNKSKIVSVIVSLVILVNLAFADKEAPIKKTKCISIEQLTNNDTPVYIFNDMKECLNQKNYQEASKLYLLGLSYGFLILSECLISVFLSSCSNIS